MKSKSAASTAFPYQLAVLLLATATAIPALAQESQSTEPSQAAPSATTQEQPSSSPSLNAPKEGFWGHLFPFASKKYVRKQTDRINDQLSELDEVNAKNAKDIRDLDARSEEGIQRAQSSADAANQAATAAGNQAQQANTTAQSAANHVNQLNTTVNGLDQYHPVTEVEVKFRGGRPVLSAEARKQLDDMAASLNGQQGYILDLNAHSPLAGGAGIASSQRLAEAVERYFVTQHNIPIYRMHAVALGNARGAEEEGARSVLVSSVHIRLMENSLAAQESASPQGADSLTGAERP